MVGEGSRRAEEMVSFSLECPVQETALRVGPLYLVLEGMGEST